MGDDVRSVGVVLCAILLTAASALMVASMPSGPEGAGTYLALCVLLLSMGILLFAGAGPSAIDRGVRGAVVRTYPGPRRAYAPLRLKARRRTRPSRVKERIVRWRRQRELVVEEPLAKATELARYRTIMKLRHKAIQADLTRHRHRFD